MARLGEEITHREESFLGYRDLRLFRQSWVADRRPVRGTVAIVHGLGEHSGAYGNIVKRLAPAGFPCYAFDLRGHGQSAGQRGSSSHGTTTGSTSLRRPGARPTTDASAVSAGAQPGRDHRSGLRYALSGQLGGVKAIAPAIGAVGISPVLMFSARIVSRIRPRFSLPTGLDVSALSRDPDVVAAYWSDPLNHNHGTARLSTEVEDTVAWVQAHARDLQVPLLIQHGGQDRLAKPDGSRRFTANIAESDKQLLEYAEMFHQVHNDIGHEAVIAALLAWLEHQAAP